MKQSVYGCHSPYRGRATALFLVGLAFGGLATGLAMQVASSDSAGLVAAQDELQVQLFETDVNEWSLFDLLELSDAQLAQIDPLLMNLIVRKGIPEFEDVDVNPYLETVQQWADMIGVGLQRGETALRAGQSPDPLYEHDPDLWKAGGMAVALAGPRIGIEYTNEPLDPRDLTQTFVAGLLDTKQGTCASMPVLYLSIAHRLKWPLQAVVSKDHMWCRWDDGEKQFNLEATTVESDGRQGSFLSTPDEEYMRKLGTADIAVECGSDLVSLSPRQLLGIFLESRAAYWAANQEYERAESDLLLARGCFPENREMFEFLHRMTALRAGTTFTEDEILAQSRRYPYIARDGRRMADMASDTASPPNTPQSP